MQWSISRRLVQPPVLLPQLQVILPTPQGLLSDVFGLVPRQLWQWEMGGCSLLSCSRHLSCRMVALCHKGDNSQCIHNSTFSSLILHTASFRGGPLGCWPQGNPCARRPRVLSLPLLTRHWAQPLGDNDTISATWLPRTNPMLLLFFQAVEENNPAAQRLPLLSVKLCRALHETLLLFLLSIPKCLLT